MIYYSLTGQQRAREKEKLEMKLPPALVILSYAPRDCAWYDSLPEAVRDVRVTLAKRGQAGAGEWATILGRDGQVRRRYRTDRRGIVQRIE